jgi:hypothetical protein
MQAFNARLVRRSNRAPKKQYVTPRIRARRSAGLFFDLPVVSSPLSVVVAGSSSQLTTDN